VGRRRSQARVLACQPTPSWPHRLIPYVHGGFTQLTAAIAGASLLMASWGYSGGRLYCPPPAASASPDDSGPS